MKDNDKTIKYDFPKTPSGYLPGDMINITNTLPILSGAMAGLINENSDLKVESNNISSGLVPHITINNGKSELTYNNITDIQDKGITINNGTSEINEKDFNTSNTIQRVYSENITEQNFPQYSIGYTADFRNIISGDRFDTNYSYFPFFTGVLLNNGNDVFWSDIKDGYVLRDFTCNLSSFYIFNSFALSGEQNQNLYVYNFNNDDIIENVSNTEIKISGYTSQLERNLDYTNNYITNKYGQIYKVSELVSSNNTFIATLDYTGDSAKSIFDIIPKDLKGHTITLNIIDAIDNTNKPNISAQHFNNGYIILSGNTIDRKTIVGNIYFNNNTSQLEFDNIKFNNYVNGINCDNLIFNNCYFNNGAYFDNCKVQIISGETKETISGINNSQIYINNCINSVSDSPIVKGYSNSQITYISGDLKNNLSSYIASRKC